MHYYLYQITNLVNKKIYIGVHTTKNLNDGYMGSGKVILCAIKKHGINNFKKEILETFETSEAMYAREKEVVTEEFVARDDVYNIKIGGHGGFKGIATFESRQKGRLKANISLEKKYGREWRSVIIPVYNSIVSEMHKRGVFKHTYFNQTHREKAQLPEAREKRKETFKRIDHQQGEKNSNFGTIWITNGIQNTKLKKDLLIPEGWKKGRFLN